MAKESWSDLARLLSRALAFRVGPAVVGKRGGTEKKEQGQK